MPDWHVYILQCRDKSLYTGVTSDVLRRIREHSGSKGSKCLRGKLRVKLVHQETYPSRSEALKREAQIKRWPRARKVAMISGVIE